MSDSAACHKCQCTVGMSARVWPDVLVCITIDGQNNFFLEGLTRSLCFLFARQGVCGWLVQMPVEGNQGRPASQGLY